MTSDPAAYLVAFGSLLLGALGMGLGTYLIIKFDQKPKKKSTDG